MKDDSPKPQSASIGVVEESGQNRPSNPHLPQTPYGGGEMGQGDAAENGASKRKVARHEALVDLILESVSAGTTLAEVCRQDWAPNVSTFYAWAKDDQELTRRLARARELGRDALESHSRLVARGEKGYSTGDVKRDRLIVDVDTKIIERWDRCAADAREAVQGARPTNLVDPRTGLYFSAGETEFAIAVIFARAEERAGIPKESRHFTGYLRRNGFPDLEACEAAMAPGGKPATPRPPTPPAAEGCDLA